MNKEGLKLVINEVLDEREGKVTLPMKILVGIIFTLGGIIGIATIVALVKEGINYFA